jgi:hypothetical protein
VMHQLYLRRSEHLAVFAQKIAHLFWEGLRHEGSPLTLDPHSFTGFGLMLHHLLERHIGACPVYFDPSDGDSWARTGPSHKNPRSDRSDQMTTQGLFDAEDHFISLIGELEVDSLTYLSHHDLRCAGYKPLAEAVHTAMTDAVVPFLVGTVFCVCGDRERKTGGVDVGQ